MIDDESCNWALRESLAGEVSQRNTITVEEFQQAGPDTRGVHGRAEPSRSAETGLNGANEQNHVHQGFSNLNRNETAVLFITVLKTNI